MRSCHCFANELLISYANEQLTVGQVAADIIGSALMLELNGSAELWCCRAMCCSFLVIQYNDAAVLGYCSYIVLECLQGVSVL